MKNLTRKQFYNLVKKWKSVLSHQIITHENGLKIGWIQRKKPFKDGSYYESYNIID